MSDISHSGTARFHIGPELRARHEQSGLVHRLTPEFEKWKLAIVNDWNKRNVTDIDINVEHQLFTFDYRYTMTDRRTGIILATGEVTVWDGNVASDDFAKQIINKIKQLREPENDSDQKDKAKDADKKGKN